MTSIRAITYELRTLFIIKYISTVSGMKTHSAKPSEIVRKWYIIDANDIVLGRLAAHVAKLLRGKHKPIYTPHIDCGDHVIIINAEKIYLSGNKKTDDKQYHHHTGYPGGIKTTNAKKILTGKFPERVFIKAVERMISRNPLGRAQMKKLHVYAGEDHPHQAQKPEVISFAELNRKNKKQGS